MRPTRGGCSQMENGGSPLQITAGAALMKNGSMCPRISGGIATTPCGASSVPRRWALPDLDRRRGIVFVRAVAGVDGDRSFALRDREQFAAVAVREGNVVGILEPRFPDHLKR